MKSKCFSGASEAAVIKAVNDWLAAEGGVTVRNTETRKEPEGGKVIFEVWYEEKAR